MTGIISAYALILIAGQLQQPPAFGNSSQSAPSNVMGLSDGWAIDDRDGSLSYIVQLSPETADQIATQGKEVQLLIPKDLQGIAQNVVIRIGNGPVERDLSPEQLLMRQRERGGDPRNAGVGNLNTLSSRPSGGIVSIDNTRTETPILPTGNGSNGARSPVSDLAQTQFSSPPSIGADLTRDALARETLPPSLQQKSILPPAYPQSNGASANGNGSFAGQGTQGYTGGGVTVEGTSVTDQFGRPQYSTSTPATNPFRTGNFGGNALNPAVPSLQNNQESYGQQTYGQRNNLNATASAPIQFAPNQLPIPSLNPNLYASNNQLTSSPYPAATYPPSQPTYSPPLLAQAPTQNAISTSEYELRQRYDTLSNAYNSLSVKYKSAPPSAAFQMFMLISVAINLYALWQLSNLYTSYRALQLSKRSELGYGLEVN